MRIIFFLWMLSLVFSGLSQAIVSNEDKSTKLISIRLDNFDVKFHLHLENTPIGSVSREQWVRDWQNPECVKCLYTVNSSIIDLKSHLMHWTLPENDFSAEDEYGCQGQVPLAGHFGEIYLTYFIMFKPGFDLVRCGKIPGFAGGHTICGSARNGLPDWEDGLGGPQKFISGPVLRAKFHSIAGSQPLLHRNEMTGGIGFYNKCYISQRLRKEKVLCQEMIFI